MKRLLRTAVVAGAATVLGSCSLPRLPGIPSFDIPRLDFDGLVKAGQKKVEEKVEEEVKEAVGRWAAEIGAAPQKLSRRCEELEQQTIPVEEEVALGGAVAVSWMETGGGLLDNYFAFDVEDKEWLPGPRELSKPLNALNVYVNTVGKNLAMQSPRPLLEWSFGVLDSENFNAFSAPGGYVMVTRGLLRKVTTEAQLAGVLAHEISHITQKHALVAYQTMRQEECDLAVKRTDGIAALKPVGDSFEGFLTSVIGAKGMSFFRTLGSEGFNLNDSNNFDLLFSLTDGLVGAISNKGFDQQQELEADQLAVELMTRAGYNPEEYIEFLGKIPKGGGANLTHHPPNAARQQALRELVKELEEDPLLAADERPFSEYAVVPIQGELAAVR